MFCRVVLTTMLLSGGCLWGAATNEVTSVEIDARRPLGLEPGGSAEAYRSKFEKARVGRNKTRGEAYWLSGKRAGVPSKDGLAFHYAHIEINTACFAELMFVIGGFSDEAAAKARQAALRRAFSQQLGPEKWPQSCNGNWTVEGLNYTVWVNCSKRADGEDEWCVWLRIEDTELVEHFYEP